MKKYILLLGFLILLAPAAFANAQSTPTVSIRSLSPGESVLVGNPVFFTAVAIGFTNPVFSASDSLQTSTLTSLAMSAWGGFKWIPKINDIGTHTITVVVTDSSGNTASVSQTITVSAAAAIAIGASSPSNTVSPGQTISFTVTPTSFTNPTYTIGDSFGATSIGNSNINSSGVFSWTPSAGDIGTHALTIYASDAVGNNANGSITLVVQHAGLTVGTTTPGTSVTVGTRFSFTTVPSGFSNPTYNVGDSFFSSSIKNANLNSTGGFTWTPVIGDIGNHIITVQAVDTYGRSANVNVSVTVSASRSAAVATSSSPTVVTTGAASKHIFNTFLALGMRNSEVTALQKVLIAGGFLKTAATGYFGPATKAAVKQFQAKHGLDQFGYVGTGTRAVLNQ